VPRLSIITVTYRAAEVLPITLRSVASQSWKDWEHIFVDGGSPDGTLEQIETYARSQERVRYLSEPDRGLYDAMNKGLLLAQGNMCAF
jgi:glycosyltransferase involved in cell wall biosynthesis